MFSANLIVIFILFGLSFLTSKNCRAFQGRIVNGTNARDGEFPFMVSLRRSPSGRHLCGSTLLNRSWALTAAHCVTGASPERLNLQYGSNEINMNSTMVVNISKIFVHEGYEPRQQYKHDIALLKLQTPIPFNGKVTAVRLPESRQITEGDEEATLIGWGYDAVSLRQAKNDGHFCAGSIIRAEWVLTAAHCFAFIKNPKEVYIQYGTTNLKPLYPNIMHVTEIIRHEGYNPTIAIHDLALIKLKARLVFNTIVKAVQLPMNVARLDAKAKQDVTVIGWGLNETSGRLHENLQKVQLTRLELSECKQKTNTFLHKTNLCASGLNRGQCNGDSGGPLLQNTIQVGVVSWSLKPCGQYPGVFTDIAFYIEWLQEQMNETLFN